MRAPRSFLRVLCVAASLSLGLAFACKPPAKEDSKATEAKAPKGAESKAPEAPSYTGPIARVNGVEVPRDDFERQMERTRSRFQRAGREIRPPLEQRLKENIIRKLIDDVLIAQKAKAEGVVVTPEELDEKFNEHKARFGNEKAFESFLERTGQSIDDVKGDLEKNLLREKLFAKLMGDEEPTEEDAKKYFEENKTKYKQREQVRASHILLKVSKTDPPEVREQKKKKAEELLALAKKPGADFAALAKEHSEGPTASRGGDLGAFSRGRMVKPFEDAAFAAKPGEVIGPVETQFGFHIIKVFEKIPERQRTFDEVKDSILTSLKARAKSKATRDLLRKLKEEAKVEVLEPGVDLERRPRASLPIAPDERPTLNPKQAEKMREMAKQAAERAKAGVELKGRELLKPAQGKAEQ